MRSARRVLPILLLYLAYAAPANAWEWPLQCVPFARAISGVRLFGDAWRWWSEAAGRYERGQAPQPGSILSFRPSTTMPLGHVAVVTRVISPRRIEIDHANWASPGAITTNAAAVDVSERNDWSAVRVELGRSDRFGAIYAADGFIYAKGRPALSREQPELIYVGRALSAARQGQRFTNAAQSQAASPSGARQGLLPWNPVPLAPAMPAFPAKQPGQAFPTAIGPPVPRDRARGTVL